MDEVGVAGNLSNLRHIVGSVKLRQDSDALGRPLRGMVLYSIYSMPE